MSASGGTNAGELGTVLGIDVGGTKIAVAAVSGTEVRHRVERSTDLTSQEALIDGIASAALEVTEAAGGVEAVGIGIPSQIDFATGMVLSSVNIPLAGISLRDDLSRRVGVPVLVDNDANCAALAEAQLVPNPPARVLGMLTLGTGVGGGIVIDGRIYRGATGLGAELGHLVIDGSVALAAEGEGFPRPGSLEWLCSGRGLEREAARLAGEDPQGALGRIHAERGRVSGREAAEAARAGDAGALELFERLGAWLGLGIASVVNALEPEHLVIGGGLSRAADLFMDVAREKAAGATLPALWERTTVDTARGGADAGVIGAARLAAQELQASGHTAEQR